MHIRQEHTVACCTRSVFVTCRRSNSQAERLPQEPCPTSSTTETILAFGIITALDASYAGCHTQLPTSGLGTSGISHTQANCPQQDFHLPLQPITHLSLQTLKRPQTASLASIEGRQIDHQQTSTSRLKHRQHLQLIELQPMGLPFVYLMTIHCQHLCLSDTNQLSSAGSLPGALFDQLTRCLFAPLVAFDNMNSIVRGRHSCESRFWHLS